MAVVDCYFFLETLLCEIVIYFMHTCVASSIIDDNISLVNVWRHHTNPSSHVIKRNTIYQDLIQIRLALQMKNMQEM